MIWPDRWEILIMIPVAGGIPSQQETQGRAVKVTTGCSCGIVDESRFNEKRQIFDGLALRLIAH